MHAVPIGLKMKNIPLATVPITTTCALAVQAFEWEMQKMANRWEIVKC